MKCTVVMDNLISLMPEQSFIAEHGFSLLIEHSGRKILFDTGFSQALLHNLSLLKVHPSLIDDLVLSHGHYDHAGGLYHFLQQGQKGYPLYAHPDIFVPRYQRKGPKLKDIGIPYTKEILSSLGVEWKLSREPGEIMPNLWFSGQIPRSTDFEQGDKGLVTVCNNCECADSFPDDSALYYKNGDGLVVIAGCAHSGLVNIVKHGLAITKSKRLIGWIGGTHLGPASREQQDKTINILEEMQPDFVMAGHCTGFLMMAEMATRLGNKFIPAFVGRSLEF